MKFISLFAGVGGFDLALERAGYECVYANEWDKYCKNIYDKHFCSRSARQEKQGNYMGQNSSNPEGSITRKFTNCYDYKRYGLDTRSITDVTTDEIPDHDLLVGGFPCQSFSIAGKRGGFDDTRGTMFFEIARILQAKKPRLFILENVKGLLSHDSGATFKTIITTLTELGYDCEWQVLNSKSFGVPQNRERVFIIGHLRGTSRPEVFPIIGEDKESMGSLGRQVSRTIEANYWKGVSPNGHQGSKRQLIRTDKTDTQSDGYQSNDSNTIRRESYSNDMRIRRLTPTECERLQGFPDGWTEGVSDTQRYKMMGNAVTVNVVEYIVGRLVI